MDNTGKFDFIYLHSCLVIAVLMPIIVCGVYLNPGGEVLFADAFMCIQLLIMLICNSHTESVSSEVLP